MRAVHRAEVSPVWTLNVVSMDNWSLTDVSYFDLYIPKLHIHTVHGSIPGGEFPFCVSIVGLPSRLQTIVIGATDSADGASFRSTITADIGSE